jgi:ADP-ribose pyrophosphatase YjhB (NUDIX family)
MQIPEGDNRERFVCDGCHRVHYVNPRIVAGCIPLWEDKVLLCRRAIEPQKGLWTIPGGFMEQHERLEEAAARETLEEAGATVELTRLQCVYSIPHISQVYLVFVGNIIDGVFAPGIESLETTLFSVEEIPWDELAFSAIRFSLEKYVEHLGSGVEAPHLGACVKDAGY